MKFKTSILLFILFSRLVNAQTILSGILPCNTILTMTGSPYIVDSSITVLPGCTLTVAAGVEIKMNTESYMYIKGSANFKGTASSPIFIHAQHATWRHIYLDSTLHQKSYFNYINIENATYGPHGYLPDDSTHQIGAVAGYYSSFEITNCTFKYNMPSIYGFHCPDALIKGNYIDSTNNGEKVLMQHCDRSLVDSNYFYFTAGLGDAIDFDASANIVIRNNHILGGDSDGIDLGNHDTTGCYEANVYGNFIQGMGDKGISCGEKCTVNAHHNVIVGCDVGIASKAASHVQSDHNTLYQNRIGLKSFDKGDGWGVGDLRATNSIIAASIDSTWSKDAVSQLVINYSLSDIELMPGNNNINDLPGFIAASNTNNGNFHLLSGSAAIDKGDPLFANDPDGTRTDMGAFYFEQLSGVPKFNSNHTFSLFPNPAKNFITIKENDLSNDLLGEKILITINNTIGQVVFSESFLGSEIKNKIIPLQLSEGLYIANIITDNTINSSKLIIDF